MVPVKGFTKLSETFPTCRPMVLVRWSAAAPEQGCVDLVDRGAGRDAELVAEHRACALVHGERFGHVAARGEGLHEQAVTGLAERVVLEQAARRALGARDLGAAESQAGGGVRFQCAVERVVESSPPQVQPWKVVVVGQQRARGHVPRAEGSAPGARPVALYDGRLGTMQGGQRLLDIDA